MAYVAIACTILTACDSDDNAGSKSSSKIDGYEYVDLGLSVKWATHNVGASKPTDFGWYIAWGETETKDNFLWSTYKFCSAYGKYNKYVRTGSGESYGYEGFEDGKDTLEDADDIATVQWGSKWRIPTVEEYYELIENCEITKTTVDGVVGYKAKAKNGNSVFFPLSGETAPDKGPILTGEVGVYWSSTVCEASERACAFGLTLESVGISKHYRPTGMQVRPVAD